MLIGPKQAGNAAALTVDIQTKRGERCQS
jgi:hypothetical protein